MMSMRTVLDVLKLAFFPGLAALLLLGGGLLFLDRKAGELLLGITPGGNGRDIPGEYLGSARVALALSLLALGLGAVLLVEGRGDLVVLFLAFASGEALPLVLLGDRMNGWNPAFVPLGLRTAFSRSLTFLLVAGCLALRFPGSVDPSLRSFRGEHAFAALVLWSAPWRAVAGAALGLAALSALVLVLGDPAWESGLPSFGRAKVGWLAGCLRAGERSFLLGTFLVLFLGYPGEGNGGYAIWIPAALGLLVLSVLLRAGLMSRGRVGRRRAQWWAVVPALLSLAAMAVVWALG